MKRIILNSLAIYSLGLTTFAGAQPRQPMFSANEIQELNLSVEQQAPTTPDCKNLKPIDDSTNVGFNATPCSGATPRVVTPNPKTTADAAFACGKHNEQWNSYCTCERKKLKYSAPKHKDKLPIGTVKLVNCSIDPNAAVDCGSFSCE
jgi:hypothetical protein